MKNTLFRLLSILLVVVMVINMLPMTVFAEQYTESQTAETSTAAELSPAQIVEEVISGRTEFSKEFKLDNGLHIAAVYPEAVHYEKDGQWEEIDNTLKSRLNGTYTNTSGLWDITFPKQLTGASSITVTKDGYTLSFGMAGQLRQSGNLEVMSTEDEAEAAAESVPTETTEVAAAASSSMSMTTETIPTTVPETTVEATVSEIVEATIPETTEEETVPETTAAETIPETTAAIEETQLSTSLESTLSTATVMVNGKAQTFAVSPSLTSRGQIRSMDNSSLEDTVEHKEFILEKASSQLLYEDAYANTDIQYDLMGNQLKESIILSSYDSALRGYRYALNVGTMIPVLNDDGSIYFYDAQKENVVMVMPAPYLEDSNMDHTDDIQVSLTGNGSNYILTYILPQAWLADSERAYPVILDPVISAQIDIMNVRDHTVASNGSYSMYRTVLECGYGPSNHVHRIFVKYREIPSLTSSDVIVGANMRMYKPGTSTNGSAVVEAHKVNGNWESETLTWENKPDYNPNVEDYAIVEAAGYYNWNVTDIVRDWYENANTGMMFKVDDATEAAGGSSWKQFRSSDYGNTSYMPTLTIAFRNFNGYESYWDYTASSAGRAGTGYVNSYSGNLVWTREDIGFSGNRMPVAISHAYNANDAASNSFGMGYGWRTDFNQKVYKWSENSSYYIWEDGDGTKHYFANESYGVFKDEDGLKLTLRSVGVNDVDGAKYSITDDKGNASYFDSNGRLIDMANNQESTSHITIAYDPDNASLITEIKDGAGRLYEFAYENSLLKSITYKGTGNMKKPVIVSYSYDADGNLISVTDPDGASASYSYTDHILTSAQDIDGYKLTYDYYVPTEDFQPYRVKKVTEYDGTKAGGELNIEYAHNQTTFTDVNGNVQILQFNDLGNVVSIQDGEGRAQYAEFAVNSSDETGKANQLTLSSKLQYTVSNRFTNSSFETETDGEGNSLLWHPARVTDSPNTASTTESYLGEKSLKVVNTSEAVSSGFSVAGNATYTFSAYVKTDGTTAKLVFHNGENIVASSEVLPAGSGWTRLEVHYTNSSETSDTLTVRLITEGTGSTYMDCVQLEDTPTASRYNLIQNGDFRSNNTFWTVNETLADGETSKIGLHDLTDGGENIDPDIAAPQLDGNVFRFTGDPTKELSISQTVPVSGGEGDTFVVAGWAKGDSIPLTENEDNPRQYGIVATFHYLEDETETASEEEEIKSEFVAKFNPDTDSSVNWQYSSQVMIAQKAYDYITIEVAYDHNANSVLFDGIQLYKEAFGQSYTYDEDGKVISVVDLQKQTTTYEYTGNDLTAEILPTGARLEYKYDDYHNVIEATSAEKLTYYFTYDAWGNNTEVSIGSGDTKITSSADYSDDGNRLESTTDAIGNTTFYNYDVDTHMLLSVQYPKDTVEDPTTEEKEDTTTHYTYDTMCRMASAAVTTDTGLNLSASYTYGTDSSSAADNDLLSSIQTASTTYNFTYGDFSLRSSIQIGTGDPDEIYTLATYKYTNDRNNYLSSLDYGNGDDVQYTYDNQGRVTKQTYEDGATVTYQYDNSGALATVTDSATGRTTTYYYDFTDRMMKYVESGDGYYHSVGYAYDDINNLTGLVETINGEIFTTAYTYDKDNRITTFLAGDAGKEYEYDDFGRTDQMVTKAVSDEPAAQAEGENSGETTEGEATPEETTPTINGTTVKTDSFTFSSDGNAISGQIESHTVDIGDKDNTYTYTYDDNGNITSVSYTHYSSGTSRNVTVSYVYDSANQLIRENNQRLNYTQVWDYDDAGNILSTTKYPYTTGDALGTATSTHAYDYDDEYGWGDLLTEYDGTEITYDEIGNPLSDGTRTFEWEHGRQLKSLTKDNVKWEYTYDANGMRTSRSNGTVTYEYVYNGDKLSQMTILTKNADNSVTTEVVNFAYDASGLPFTLTYIPDGAETGTTYYYVTNIQGDVVGLTDSEGTLIISYFYEAYGSGFCSTYGNDEAALLSRINPLAYRSYVLDIGTGLYYLQTRYYDPSLGRFLNADAFATTGQGLLGNNMFAYCGNNPIVNTDAQGMQYERSAGLGYGGASFSYDGIGSGSTGGTYNGTHSGNTTTTSTYSTIAATVILTDSVRYFLTTVSLRSEMIALRKYNQTIAIEEEASVAIAIFSTSTQNDVYFYGADMVGGTWKTVTGPLSADEAKVWVASRLYGKRSKWGLYTANQHDALQMAWDLGLGLPPIPHLDRLGEYPHYHVGDFLLWGQYKHFHVWFGSINGG